MLTACLALLPGTSSLPPGLLGIGTPLVVGWPRLSAPLALAAVAIVVWIRVDIFRLKPSFRQFAFPLYLIAVGVIAAAAYAMFRPYSLATTQYGLLLLVAPIEVTALQPARATVMRAVAATSTSVQNDAGIIAKGTG